MWPEDKAFAAVDRTTSESLGPNEREIFGIIVEKTSERKVSPVESVAERNSDAQPNESVVHDKPEEDKKESEKASPVDLAIECGTDMELESPSAPMVHDEPEEKEVNDKSVDGHDHERSAEIVGVSPLRRGAHESELNESLAIDVAEEIVPDEFEMRSVPDRGFSAYWDYQNENAIRQWCLERHLAHVLLTLLRLLLTRKRIIRPLAVTRLFIQGGLSTPIHLQVWGSTLCLLENCASKSRGLLLEVLGPFKARWALNNLVKVPVKCDLRDT
ncbi:hypothetical protein VTN31DRAFT_5636 [Thermomyces dupontii]|uniref:uncharacterized protein n=1 Tax=Talaromyces thermophilus TaxID=28565 RepID=UPI0037449283